MSSAKWSLFCLGLNVLTNRYSVMAEAQLIGWHSPPGDDAVRGPAKTNPGDKSAIPGNPRAWRLGNGENRLS